MQTPLTVRLSTVSSRLFWILAASALAIRLILISTSFGSTDAFLFTVWVDAAEKHGLLGAYRFFNGLNHPPMSMAIAVAADRIGKAIGLEFPDIFRLLQVIADIVTATFVYRIANRLQPSRAREYTLFFFASPAAIFLSGFHCNSDPTMIALLSAAVWAATREKAAGSGVLFGLSSNIKILPIPLAPLFLINMKWRQRILWSAGAALILLLGFLPALGAMKNIFGYAPAASQWGIGGTAYLVSYLAHGGYTTAVHLAAFYSQWGRYIVLAAIAALFFFYIRYKTPIAAMIGAALLTIDFLAPGFGIQYLVWPLAFVPFAVPRRLAYALNAGLSIFMFTAYTVWARELPWWYADASKGGAHGALIAYLALPLWLLYGAAVVAALRNSARQLGPQQLAE